MGSSPKKQKPGPNERMLAAVSDARFKRNRAIYNPLLINQRDEAQSKDNINYATSLANANTMQALDENQTVRGGQVNLGLVSKATDALSAETNKATQTAKKLDTNRAVQVLNAANQKGQTAVDGMRTLAKIESSEAVNKLKNDALVGGAKTGAIGQIAGAGLTYGASKGLFGDKVAGNINKYYGIS